MCGLGRRKRRQALLILAAVGFFAYAGTHNMKRVPLPPPPSPPPTPPPCPLTHAPAEQQPATGQQPVLRCFALTYDRAKPLLRLLVSLRDAQYNGARIDLNIMVDKPKDKDGKPVPHHADVLKVANEFKWKHGSKKIVLHKENVGLQGQWIDSWRPDAHTTEMGIMLEDDLQVSPFYFKWLHAAHKKYADRDYITGFTLARASMRASTGGDDLKGGPKKVMNFGYRVLGSWGYSPTARHWMKFREWYHANRATMKPYVENIKPTVWYKIFESRGQPWRMWTIWHLKYADLHHDQYCVYVNIQKEQCSFAGRPCTLSASWRENGVNYYGPAQGPDHKLLDKWFPKLLDFPDEPLTLGWNGKPEKSAWKPWPAQWAAPKPQNKSLHCADVVDFS